jgi:hypothetical protein
MFYDRIRFLSLLFYLPVCFTSTGFNCILMVQKCYTQVKKFTWEMGARKGPRCFLVVCHVGIVDESGFFP